MKIPSLSLKEFIFYTTILFLPTQLGYHFWPAFATVDGIRIDYLSPTLYATDVLIFLQLIILLKSEFLKIQISRIVSGFEFKISSILFAVLLFGIVFSVNQGAGFYGLLKIIEMIGFGFLVSRMVNNKTLPKVLTVLSVSLMFESVLAIFQFIHHGAFGGLFYFFGERMITGTTPGAANASINGQLLLRPYATLSHPNILAGFLVVSSILLFLRPVKKLQSAALILSTIGIVVSLSRTAIFVWLIFLVLQFVMYNLKIALTLLAFGWIVFSTGVFERFAHFNLGDESVVERIQLTRAAFSMIVSHPLLGVGLNNFFNQLILLPQLYHYPLQPVHNIFLLIASETGLVGLMIALYFWWQSFAISKNNTIKIALLSIMALGMTDHYFLTSQQGLLILAVVFGLSWNKVLHSKRI